AAVEVLPACVGVAEGCGRKTCKVDADQFFVEYVENGEIIHDGLLKGLGDTGGGVLALILSLLVVCFSLFCMVKLLHSLILGKAKAIILRYLAGWGTSMVTAGFVAGDGSKHDTTKAERSQ
ncbi:unnamed protein product, partial [Durusdinium trenchii]